MTAVLLCCYHKHAEPYQRPTPQASTLAGQIRSALTYAEYAAGPYGASYDIGNRTNRRERMAAAAARLRAKLAAI